GRRRRGGRGSVGGGAAGGGGGRGGATRGGGRGRPCLRGAGHCGEAGEDDAVRPCTRAELSGHRFSLRDCDWRASVIAMAVRDPITSALWRGAARPMSGTVHPTLRAAPRKWLRA